jgi:large subunit ribosomal protein L9
MKVILTVDVPDVGSRGDRLDVAAGYARNFLLPRQLAVAETIGSLRVLAEENKRTGTRDRKAVDEAKKIAAFLEDHQLFATLKIGREGKSFGAITSKDIAILLSQAGLDVDRRRIQLAKPIKRLGAFAVPLVVHPEVPTPIRVFVDREGGSIAGAEKEQAVFDERQRVIDEAAKAEADARAEREAEAEEVARAAIEKAAARRAREEEDARAREEAEKAQKKVDDDMDMKSPSSKSESA